MTLHANRFSFASISAAVRRRKVFLAATVVVFFIICFIAYQSSDRHRVNEAREAFLEREYDVAYGYLRKVSRSYVRRKAAASHLMGMTCLELAKAARSEKKYDDCIAYLDEIPDTARTAHAEALKIRTEVRLLADSRAKERAKKRSTFLRVAAGALATVAGMVALVFLVGRIRRWRRAAIAETELPRLQCPRCMDTTSVEEQVDGQLLCPKCARQFRLPLSGAARRDRNWHFRRGTKEFGPVSEYALLTMVFNRFLSPDTEVWNERIGGEWLRARYLPGLIPPDMLVPSSHPPKLWHPALLGWLSAIVPCFALLGSWLTTRNWRELGLRQRAARSNSWFIAFAVAALATVAYASLAEGQNAMVAGLNAVLLFQVMAVIWAASDGNAQNVFVRKRVGRQNYVRRSIALTAAVWIAIVGLGGLYLHDILERSTRDIRDTGFRQSIVVIQGNAGAGTGFLCRLKGIPVVLSNAHVLIGNRYPKLLAVDGKEIRYKAVYLAPDRDVAAYELYEEDQQLYMFLPIVEDVEHLAVGEEIVVQGNSRAQGVVTTIKGRLLGVGPTEIEVDAKFVRGNSGSPIIAYSRNAVVGIATRAVRSEINWTDLSTRFVEVRRMGVRIDNLSIAEYEQLDPNYHARVLDEADALKQFANRHLALLLRAMAGETGARIPQDVRAEARRHLAVLESWPKWFVQYGYSEDGTLKLAAAVCARLSKGG